MNRQLMRQKWKTYEPYNCVRRCHVKGVTEAYFEVRGSGIEPNMDQTNERPLTDHTDQTNEHAEPFTTKPNERAPHREREREARPQPFSQHGNSYNGEAPHVWKTN